MGIASARCRRGAVARDASSGKRGPPACRSNITDHENSVVHQHKNRKGLGAHLSADATRRLDHHAVAYGARQHGISFAPAPNLNHRLGGATALTLTAFWQRRHIPSVLSTQGRRAVSGQSPPLCFRRSCPDFDLAIATGCIWSVPSRARAC
jgi:hypothetical protein